MHPMTFHATRIFYGAVIAPEVLEAFPQLKLRRGVS